MAVARQDAEVRNMVAERLVKLPDGIEDVQAAACTRTVSPGCTR